MGTTVALEFRGSLPPPVSTASLLLSAKACRGPCARASICKSPGSMKIAHAFHRSRQISPEPGIEKTSDQGHLPVVIRKAGPNGPPGLGKSGRDPFQVRSITRHPQTHARPPRFLVRARSVTLDRVRRAFLQQPRTRSLLCLYAQATRQPLSLGGLAWPTSVSPRRRWRCAWQFPTSRHLPFVTPVLQTPAACHPGEQSRSHRQTVDELTRLTRQGRPRRRKSLAKSASFGAQPVALVPQASIWR
jgi:hypothetical protein